MWFQLQSCQRPKGGRCEFWMAGYFN
ncbi:hypothetical protein Gotur_014522 [Gossypium turneri]